MALTFRQACTRYGEERLTNLILPWKIPRERPFCLPYAGSWAEKLGVLMCCGPLYQLGLSYFKYAQYRDSGKWYGCLTRLLYDAPTGLIGHTYIYPPLTEVGSVIPPQRGLIHYPLCRLIPTSRIRDSPPGTGIGGCHDRPFNACAPDNCDSLIIRASLPPGVSR